MYCYLMDAHINSTKIALLTYLISMFYPKVEAWKSKARKHMAFSDTNSNTTETNKDMEMTSVAVDAISYDS